MSRAACDEQIEALYNWLLCVLLALLIGGLVSAAEEENNHRVHNRSQVGVASENFSVNAVAKKEKKSVFLDTGGITHPAVSRRHGWLVFSIRVKWRLSGSVRRRGRCYHHSNSFCVIWNETQAQLIHHLSSQAPSITLKSTLLWFPHDPDCDWATSARAGGRGGVLSCLSCPAPLTTTLPVKTRRGVRRKLLLVFLSLSLSQASSS